MKRMMRKRFASRSPGAQERLDEGGFAAVPRLDHVSSDTGALGGKDWSHSEPEEFGSPSECNFESRSLIAFRAMDMHYPTVPETVPFFGGHKLYWSVSRAAMPVPGAGGPCSAVQPEAHGACIGEPP